LLLALPSSQKKIEDGLNEVRADIEAKLVASGPGVTRHVELPAQGKTRDWIVAEMERMDTEISGHNDWKAGKVSGAVYRMAHSFLQVLATS
jgi:sphinganine-1-phosphate aldolase